MYFHLQLIPLTIIYVAMAITGIIGNISVCWVILRIPYMRSATNYYLFSLAVSDLLILLLGNQSPSKKFPIYFIHESKSCFFYQMYFLFRYVAVHMSISTKVIFAIILEVKSKRMEMWSIVMARITIT